MDGSEYYGKTSTRLLHTVLMSNIADFVWCCSPSQGEVASKRMC